MPEQDSLGLRVLITIEELLRERHPDQPPVDTARVLQRMRLDPDSRDDVASAMSQLLDDGCVHGKELRGDVKVMDVTVTAITEAGLELLPG
jgi:hypothetical protein